MDNLYNKLIQLLKAFIAIDLAVLCIVIFVNVIGRFFFESLIWSVEIARFLFVYMIFFGAIIALKEKRHFRVDILINRFPDMLRKLLEIISNLLVLFILYTIFIGSWELLYVNWESTTTILKIPYSFMYLLGILASVPMSIIIIIDSFRLFQGKDGEVNQD